MGKKLLGIKIGVANNVKDFLNIDSASCSLKKNRKGVAYTEKLWDGNGMTFVQTTGMFPRFAVLMRGEGRWRIEYGGRKG